MPRFSDGSPRWSQRSPQERVSECIVEQVVDVTRLEPQERIQERAMWKKSWTSLCHRRRGYHSTRAGAESHRGENPGLVPVVTIKTAAFLLKVILTTTRAKAKTKKRTGPTSSSGAQEKLERECGHSPFHVGSKRKGRRKGD